MTMMTRNIVACATFWLCTAVLIPGAQAQNHGGQEGIHGWTTADWNMIVVSDDLDYPWDIEQTAGRILITEATGFVVMIERGRQTRAPMVTSDPILREGGAGLLGMALALDFSTSGVAYFYHSYRSASGMANKIIEARFDGHRWKEMRTLLAGIPGHRLYNGGRIAIGPDNLLYVTTGWTEDHDLPQNLHSLAGKVLRMTTGGKVPAGNPFPGSFVYSFGYRNPQGMAWNQTGQMFVVEHGQSAHDEINLVKPGANYGWPLTEGSTRREGMEPAWVESGRETWAPSGAAFFRGQLLIAALGARGILAVSSDRASKLVFSSGERVRDLLAVDSDIYLITTNRSPRGERPSRDRVLRLSPKR